MINRHSIAGAWNDAVGDLVPMAVSNIFQCMGTIYSDGNIPVLHFQPTLRPDNDPIMKVHPVRAIELARKTTHGKEHFDSVLGQIALPEP